MAARFDTWKPGKHALFFDRINHPSGEDRPTIIVSHPTAAASCTLSEKDAINFDCLKGVGLDYLKALKATLEEYGYICAGQEADWLPQAWLDELGNGTSFKVKCFDWLPLWPSMSCGRSPENPPQPVSSYWLPHAHEKPGAGGTVILIAGEILQGEGDHAGPLQPIGSDFGIRLVMHIGKFQNETHILISAMTAHLPFGEYTTLAQHLLSTGEKFNGGPQQIRSDLERVLNTQNCKVARQLRLREKTLVFNKFRFLTGVPATSGDEGLWFEASGQGIGLGSAENPKDGGSHTLAYGFSVRAPVAGDSGAKIRTGNAHSLVTGANKAMIFRQDPASWRGAALHGDLDDYDWQARRPTRTDVQLNAFRSKVDLRGIVGGKLERKKDFAVFTAPNYVKTDRPFKNQVKEISASDGLSAGVRSNTHTAISAYRNCSVFYDLMREFGIDPELYFARTEQRAEIHYRSGIRPGKGKDGQTVNARVALTPVAAKGTAKLSIMEMHLALANLSHRTRRSDQAEPLGIATSMRWMWHEFGHFLIAGRFNELEFRFCHSIGDALAAVYADPESRLADPRDECAKRFRGLTFPWVFLTRRHDRCVLDGWSWGGTLHRSLIDAPEYQRKAHKGYLSEQILSSTLFRLYLILGGQTQDVEDAGPDYNTRETASKVVLYLIIRGLQTFGHIPAAAEELEAALVDADRTVSGSLVLELIEEDQAYHWQGGQAHKVIRWSFEAQGMHQLERQENRNMPGMPPPVDIYVKDHRPHSEWTGGRNVEHGSGAYVPVCLAWAGGRCWMAGTSNHETLTFHLGNRGSVPARDISVRIWIGSVGGDTAKRHWDRDGENLISWISPYKPQIICIDKGLQPDAEMQYDVPVPRGDPDGVEFTHRLVLIEISCQDDRANSDPEAMLPCAITGTPPTLPRALADLVANDNNLGLWMLS
ncbi:hypothetical protein [Roseibium sp. RKSG952]|uniref:hypothetical protein n=1 Tax=Roseibium sp. RKSG952 TaxID=2529384 RepID=UPI0012BC745E|nr:hypothetical protein [Roseibium sp. RKSG952]MTH95212.1 hypothetical protein [Roseibium sp. RKSG952]